MFPANLRLLFIVAVWGEAVIFLLSFENDSDREKFEYMYSKYKNLLLKKAWEILNDYMLAEDAVSEAFLRLYKNLYKIDDPASNQSIAFIVTIVRNVSLTILSREKSKSAEPADEEQSDGFDLEESILSDISSEHIYEILNGIDEDLRGIFLFKFAYGMSHREIASALKISENNVTVKLHRAKKKLASILVKEGYAHGIR